MRKRSKHRGHGERAVHEQQTEKSRRRQKRAHERRVPVGVHGAHLLVGARLYKVMPLGELHLTGL
jgi:hypothetical protein